MIEVEDQSEFEGTGIRIGLKDGLLVLQASASNGMVTVVMNLETATRFQAAMTQGISAMKGERVLQ